MAQIDVTEFEYLRKKMPTKWPYMFSDIQTEIKKVYKAQLGDVARLTFNRLRTSQMIASDSIPATDLKSCLMTKKASSNSQLE